VSASATRLSGLARLHGLAHGLVDLLGVLHGVLKLVSRLSLVLLVHLRNEISPG